MSVIMTYALLVRGLSERLADIMEQHRDPQKRLRLHVVYCGDRMAVKIAVMMPAVLFKIKSPPQLGNKDRNDLAVTSQDEIRLIAAEQL